MLVDQDLVFMRWKGTSRPLYVVIHISLESIIITWLPEADKKDSNLIDSWEFYLSAF